MSIDKNDSTFSEFCLKYIENFKTVHHALIQIPNKT